MGRGSRVGLIDQWRQIGQVPDRALYDKVLDDLYEKQSRTTDAGERRRLIREFEKRLLDDETHYIPTLQYHRIIPHSAKVRGWTITTSIVTHLPSVVVDLLLALLIVWPILVIRSLRR